MLLSKKEGGAMASVSRAVLKPITWAFPTAISIPIPILARGMLNITLKPTAEKVELLENKAIHLAAGKE